MLRTYRTMTRLQASEELTNAVNNILLSHSSSFLQENILEFKKVNIYDDFSSGEPLIENVSFEILHQDKLLLVSDASTPVSSLIDLILQFNLEYSGRLLYKGHVIKNLKLESLRQEITYYENKPNLFLGTIKDNINPGFYKEKLKPSLVDIVREVLDAFDFDYKNFMDNLSQDQFQNLKKRVKTKKERVDFDKDFFYDVKKFYNLISTEFDPSNKLLSYQNKFAISVCRLFVEAKELILLDRLIEFLPSENMIDELARLMEKYMKEKTIIMTMTQEAYQDLKFKQKVEKIFGRVMVFKNGKVVSDSIEQQAQDEGEKGNNA